MEIVKSISVMFIFLILSMQSCMSQDEKMECLNEALEVENKELMSTLKDSIQSWSRRELRSMSRFNPNVSTWKVDALIQNSSADRLFGWILQVDNDESKDALDYVKFYSGEKRNGQWFFYLHNMPKTWADREDNGNQKYTFEQLSEIARKEVVNGGLVNEYCTIDDAYINGWIDREGRNLFEWHKEFLQSNSN